MELVKTEVKSFKDYQEFIDVDTRLQLEYYAKKLKGKRIAMVNATAYGGGVAEILHSLVPLARDMGVDIDWWKMEGSDQFFTVTKSIHNCLQGKGNQLTAEDKEIYLEYNRRNVLAIKDWIMTSLSSMTPTCSCDSRPDEIGPAKWIWRCHIDTSHGS